MQQPDLSPTCDAIVVNYNAGALLREAVASLLCAESVANIFVVDNGSTDSSLYAIERLSQVRPSVKIIRNRCNLGFAKACNLPLGDVTADYVLYLNPDCLVEGDAVKTLLHHLAAFPQAVMAGPLLTHPDGSEQPGGRRAIPTPWRSFVRAFGLMRLGGRYPRLFSDFLLHTQPLPDKPIEVEAISGACMLVRREAIEDVGPMDEGYFMHCEDLDWCARFRLKGRRILFVPSARVVHYKGACSRSRPIFVEWHKHKGMVRFYRKFFCDQYPGMLMGLVTAGVWLRFGAFAAFHGVHHLQRWVWRGRK